MMNEETLQIATDARDSDRMGDAVRILLGEGLTLHAALDALTPARKPEIGDILACSWGYEQTRVYFYQVVRVTPKQIKIRQISKRYVSRGEHGEANVLPIRDAFFEECAARKTLARTFEYTAVAQRVECDGPRQPLTQGQPLVEVKTTSKTRYRCAVASYSNAYLWDGEACRESGDY